MEKKNTVRQIFFRALFSFLFILAASMIVAGMGSLESAAALTLDQTIAEAQSRYENTRDIKADFTQVVHLKSMKRTEREEGTFYFKNPRRMVWDYARPMPKKLVINPRTAWLYVPEDGMVYVQDAESVFKSKVSLRFLAGAGKLKEDFDIAFATPDGLDSQGNYVLKLKPKEQDFGIEALFLTLERKKFQILRFSFTDGYGNSTELQFRNITVNNNLPEDLFTFSPPPGVEVYHNR